MSIEAQQAQVTAAERGTSQYTLDNAWHAARARLAAVEATLDPTTQRQLQTVGVGAGWHCLEVGAGGGSIADWLCQQVGPTGSVVATDIDTRFVAARC